MYNYFFLWILFTLGSVNEVPGQRTEFGQVSQVQWEEKELSDGIIWKYGQFENLFDSKQSITVFEVDLSKENVGVTVPHVESGFVKTSEFGERSGAVAAINGSFFNTKTGGSVVFLMDQDSIYTHTIGESRDYRENAGFAMDGDGHVAMVHRPVQGWESLDMYPSVLASGPMLIYGGKPLKQVEEAFNLNRHPRTAIGLTQDNTLIAVVVDGRNSNAHGMSMGELAIL
ncbi:MAG TPA: phosphodiester glycosidase family protein, partial [Aquaticitalea sp.]|nr:phosphodiester glycosidase family protein [Aquaticitalea sp.]